MFVITSTYLKPREEMETLLADHAQWLKIQHEAGFFISSGSNLERTGAAILAQSIDRSTLENIIAQSPFAQAGAAHYDIIEMGSPSACQESP